MRDFNIPEFWLILNHENVIDIMLGNYFISSSIFPNQFLQILNSFHFEANSFAISWDLEIRSAKASGIRNPNIWKIYKSKLKLELAFKSLDKTNVIIILILQKKWFDKMSPIVNIGDLKYKITPRLRVPDLKLNSIFP